MGGAGGTPAGCSRTDDRQGRPEPLEVAEERHAFMNAVERCTGRLEPAAELLETDDRHGCVAEGDGASAGEDQRQRQGGDEHRCRHERSNGRQRHSPADEEPKSRHADVPERIVPKAQGGSEAPYALTSLASLRSVITYSR